MRRFVFIGALAAGLAQGSSQGLAQTDAFDVGAPEGAERTAHLVRAYDAYDLPTGAFERDAATIETLRGKVTWQAFRLDDPAASTAGIMDGYRARLAELGFQPIFHCRTRDCGGFDFRFGAAILPPPAMLLDVRDFVQHSAVSADPEGHVSILVSRVRETIYVQTVAVMPAEPPDAPTSAPAISADTKVSLLPADERALLERLLADGHVPIEGLSFDQGGTRLSGASDEALDMLARLLTRDAVLEVVIVGHSDNDGGLEANLDLSGRRAEAVRRALVERGVPEGQVESRGIAFLAPIVSNATPEGRARNRRVEIVLRRGP